MKSEGQFSHIILFTAARFARNLAGFRFCGKDGQPQAAAAGVEQGAALEALSGGFTVTAESADFGTKRALAERYIFEGDPYSSAPATAVIAKEMALSVNDREHIKVFAFEPGLAPAAALAKAKNATDELGRKIPYSFSRDFGFLTAAPREAGTGLKIFALANLPALELAGRTADVLKTLPNLRLNHTPLNAETFALSGPLHIISNMTTLCAAPEEIAAALERGLRFLITAEQTTRIELASGPERIKMEDSAFRAMALLQNARSISYEETAVLLSNAMLGLAMGYDLKVKQDALSWLLTACKPGHIALACATAKHKPTPQERDVLRAALLRKTLTLPQESI